MKPWRSEFTGTWDERQVDSQALKHNALGDPSQRPIWVYLPPAYATIGAHFPTVYVLQGFAGQVDKWWNRSAFLPTVPERIDALFALENVPPAIVVLVDAWTALGGSQFLNSPATGRYLDYLCDDVVTFIDRNYRTIAQRECRGITGHSSGGYGAMIAPMLRADVFGALATHAGDALFEYCYLPDIAAAARALTVRYQGEIERFWEDFHAREPLTKRDDFTLLNVYAMSACYSAEPDATVTLPFDPFSGRLRDDVWQRWLAHDPVRMVPHYADTLRSLRAIYIDAGNSDEYFLDLGARAFSRELSEHQIAHHFELFDGGHGGNDWRYPQAIRFLAQHLAP